jgi:hypothetical protein
MSTPIQLLAPQYIGYMPSVPATPTTVSLNSASTWIAFGFTPDLAKTLARFKIQISMTGTLASTDVSCDIYSSTAGHPNASLVSTTTLTAALTALTTWAEFGGTGTGLNLSLGAGTPYWAVIKNLNASPTVNFPIVKYPIQTSVPFGTGHDWRVSTWNGTTWTAGNGCAGYRFEFTDGTLAGLPVIPGLSADHLFGSTQSGFKFTVPAGATLNAKGAMFSINIGGVPTGPLQINLWTGASPTTPVATSYFTSDAAAQAVGFHGARFASPVALTPGTIVRVTLQNTSGTDNSSNYVTTFENVTDLVSSALMPLQGTFCKTTWNGSTWTDTATTIPNGLLELDSNGEFTSAGGGGGGAPSVIRSNGYVLIG